MPAIGRSCISSATRRRRKAPRPPSTMSPSPHPAWTPMPSGSRRRMLPSKPASCPGPSATRSSWPIPTASKSSCSSTPRTRHAGRQSRGHRRPPPAPARPSANRRRPGAAMLPQQRRERRASGALAMAAPRAIAGWRLGVALAMALLLTSLAPRRAAAGPSSAKPLGSERRGKGVIIAAPAGGNQVLVLTIGYLVIEADEIDIVGNDERTLPARFVAYDPDSGFGLLRPSAPIDLKPLELGRSAELAEGMAALVAGHGGAHRGPAGRIVSPPIYAGRRGYPVARPTLSTPPP